MTRKIILVLGAVVIVGLLALNWFKLMSLAGVSQFAPPQGNQLGKVFFLEGNFQLPQGAEKQLVGKRYLRGQAMEFFQVKGLQVTFQLDEKESYTFAPVLLDNDYFGLRLWAKKPARDYRRVALIRVELPGEKPLEIKDVIVGDGRIDLGSIKLAEGKTGQLKTLPGKSPKKSGVLKVKTAR